MYKVGAMCGKKSIEVGALVQLLQPRVQGMLAGKAMALISLMHLQPPCSHQPVSEVCILLQIPGLVLLQIVDHCTGDGGNIKCRL